MKRFIRVSDYVDKGREEMLAQAGKSELGQVIMNACERRSAKVVADMRKNPKIGCEKIEEDIRYRLGQSDEVEFILDLMTECQREITNNP